MSQPSLPGQRPEAEPTKAAAPPADEIVQVADRYYILATSSLADEHDRVLKQDETFAVFDRYGDIKPVGLGEEGIYQAGTRYLSGLMLRIGRQRPMLLSSTVREDNALLAVDLTNPDLRVADRDELAIARGLLHVARTAFLWDGVCHERVALRNYALHEISVPIELSFEADFADIFEVRGARRERRGTTHPPQLVDGGVDLRYDGLDDRTRCTKIRFAPAPAELDGTRARYRIELAPQAETVIEIAIACEEPGRARPLALDESPDVTGDDLARIRERGADIQTSNEQFNEWLRRSDADLAMMSTRTPHGEYPYAGVPWYSTVFGRDGIITALECLWFEPDVARDVLRVLAAYQGDAIDPARDEEPGKIVHEMRQGEMAALGEVPFGRYYGTADATPLYLMLAGAYYRRTNDLDFMRQLWPHVERAMEWVETYGDPDGDGFIEYQRHRGSGLANQGWKDSTDSVFHADGMLADGPIALCEIQGYAFAARREIAVVARALGRHEVAERLDRDAEALRRHFEDAFWLEELGTYAEALDGQKQPCRVRTSNPGHCLYSGIVSPERAERVAGELLSPQGFSGWGIRTVATGESRYNPMSYHDGSVWPHDNAIIAAGMARYGMTESALRVLESLFDASLYIDLRRLPELFCGFERRHGEGPTAYPVACSPQAWSAGAVFLLLQACLGIEIDAPDRTVRFTNARLPDMLDEVWISGLQVGDASLDIALQRRTIDVGIDVLRKQGEVRVVAVK